jgi:hypothetical protein
MSILYFVSPDYHLFIGRSLAVLESVGMTDRIGTSETIVPLVVLPYQWLCAAPVEEQPVDILDGGIDATDGWNQSQIATLELPLELLEDTGEVRAISMLVELVTVETGDEKIPSLVDVERTSLDTVRHSEGIPDLSLGKHFPDGADP